MSENDRIYFRGERLSMADLGLKDSSIESFKGTVKKRIKGGIIGSYKDTVLYQFLETGTSDNTFMGLDQLLKCFGFSPCPLSF